MEVHKDFSTFWKRLPKYIKYLFDRKLNSTARKCDKYECSVVGQYELCSFQTGGKKFERFLPKNQNTKRKLLNFENWVNGEVSKSAKTWLSKSIFYVKNYPNLSFFFIAEYQFKNIFFVFDNINFKSI